MSVKVTGLTKLHTRLVDLQTSALDRAVEVGARATAEAIRDTAKELCPVGTPESTGKAGYVGGSLRDSIRLQVSAKPAGHIHKIGVSAGGYVTNPNTGRKVDYPVYVERGTSKMAPQPFMAPARQKHIHKLANQVRMNLKK